MLTKILHTGVAVPDLKKAVDFYKEFGFSVEKKFHKPDIDADVALVTKGEATYELFEFHNTSHPDVRFIRNHVAIYSDDLDKDMHELVEKGYKIVIPVTEGIVYRFAFLQDASGTNYEIATAKT